MAAFAPKAAINTRSAMKLNAEPMVGGSVEVSDQILLRTLHVVFFSFISNFLLVGQVPFPQQFRRFRQSL